MFGDGFPAVENFVKNNKNCIQKVVDIRVLGAYNRDSS